MNDGMLMRTYTDRRVDPMNLRSIDVDVLDIAHALARQCRFNGHCAGFISVAAHSVRVYDALDVPSDKEWGLMHDAAEAYLGDVIRPMKYSGKFDMYLEAERIAEQAVAERFDLPWPIPRAVKRADDAAAAWEIEHGWSNLSTFDEDEEAFMERFRRHWT